MRLPFFGLLSNQFNKFNLPKLKLVTHYVCTWSSNEGLQQIGMGRKAHHGCLKLSGIRGLNSVQAENNPQCISYWKCRMLLCKVALYTLHLLHLLHI